MYRSVVSQQGRVTLEADANEGEEIRAEEARADLIDVIGPTGAPAGGFSITVPAAGLVPFDFAIGQGAIYVGGLRVTNPDEQATYLGQRTSEWTDYPAGWGSEEPATGPRNEAIYLSLSEQEVSAVEDEALREVALGGPDTCARLRLLQRVQRWLVDGSSCEAAFAQMLEDAHGETASFDPETMRLESKARLKVDFVAPPAPPDICQPTARSGFLGPENQLIRVQVLDTDTMLWGWDNASFVYRVTVPNLPGPKQTLTLGGIPVDAFHQPRPGQWVELLEAAVDLGAGAHLASPVGVAFQVDGYDPANRNVTLTTAIPGSFLERPALFLRIWENKLPFAASETTPTELVDASGVSTGVVVYVKNTRRIPGDHWMIGVRPSTPQAILPARLASFQPPDGPRRWLAPLAVIEWNQEGRASKVTDCRPPFLDLVELTRRKAGCCELVVAPGEDIQRAIDSLPPEGGAVCLKAGTHQLQTALRIARSRVTLHGESAGSVLEAALPAGGTPGLTGVLLDIGNGEQELSDVIIRDLAFVVTPPPTDAWGLFVSIDRCTRAQIRGCRFTAPAPVGTTSVALCGATFANLCRDLTFIENVIERMFLGLAAGRPLGRIEVRHNRIVGLTLSLPVTPTETVEISAGERGVLLQSDPDNPASGVQAFIEHNWLEHFASAIDLAAVLDVASVLDNTIATGFARVLPGPFPEEDSALPTYLAEHAYTINCASNNCAIRGNRIELGATAWGGIRVSGQHASVEANAIVATIQEWMVAPVGIFVTATSAFEGAHHAVVRDNVLLGPQAGITASGCAEVEISRNHLDGNGRAPYAVALLDGSDALIKDNRIAGTADGRPALFANLGENNRFEGNQIRGGSYGMVARDQTHVAFHGNSVQHARMGGIWLANFDGVAEMLGNRVVNCGFFNELGHGIAVQGNPAKAGVHLRVEGCEIIDTAVVGPLATRANGIFATRLLSCQLVGNRVGYTDLDAVDQTHQHPAIALEGVDPDSNEQRSGQALISANTLSGTGELLAAVRGFQKETFSNNICRHLTGVQGGATVLLSGAHLIALGNHIEANDEWVPSFRLSRWARASLTGNLTTGGLDANPAPTPASLAPQPYEAFNIKL